MKRELEDAPHNISKKALALRDLADSDGVYGTIATRFGNMAAVIPNLPRLAALSIDELCLSVRASNGLMRAGVSTFGKLATAMNQENGRYVGPALVNEPGFSY